MPPKQFSREYLNGEILGKWEEWRGAWCYVRVPCRLECMEDPVAPVERGGSWGNLSPRDHELAPALERIFHLRREGLTMRHVISDFLPKRIAPLQERSREAWSYSGMLDRTRVQPGPAGELPQSMYTLLMRQLTGVEAPLPPLPVTLLSLDPSREEIISRMPACDEWGILDSWPSPLTEVPCGPARRWWLLRL